MDRRRARSGRWRHVAGFLLLAALGAACGDAPPAAVRDLCGDGVKPCACGDTVVADHTLTADVVCAASHGRCDVESFACTGLTLASGVTLDGDGFALIGPPLPAASGALPDARRDALYGVELPATTSGARVAHLEVRGFVRGVVFRNALRPCAGDRECGPGGCVDIPRELADSVPDPAQRYCAGNTAADVTVRHDPAIGTQLGVFGFAISAPDPDATGDVGGMNVIEGGRVLGSGDRAVHLSQARLNVVRGVYVADAANENVHLLRGADDNLTAGCTSLRADGAAPNVLVEDSKRNLFLDDELEGSFVHVVGASDGNRFVDVRLSGAGARYDLETDVEEATGVAVAPRDNLVLRGGVVRTGSGARPCVILDGASGSVFDDVELRCGDAPDEERVDVRVARDNPESGRPNVFHVADCVQGAPELHVRRDPGVREQPLVLEDRPCTEP